MVKAVGLPEVVVSADSPGKVIETLSEVSVAKEDPVTVRVSPESVLVLLELQAVADRNIIKKRNPFKNFDFVFMFLLIG